MPEISTGSAPGTPGTGKILVSFFFEEAQNLAHKNSYFDNAMKILLRRCARKGLAMPMTMPSTFSWILKRPLIVFGIQAFCLS